jgi:hypothetical protein
MLQYLIAVPTKLTRNHYSAQNLHVNFLLQCHYLHSVQCYSNGGVIKQLVVLNFVCHWVGSAIEPEMSLSQGCHWVRDVIESGLQLTQRSHLSHQVMGVIWVRIWAVIVSGLSLNHECHLVIESELSLSQRNPWAKGFNESEMSVSGSACASVVSVCQCCFCPYFLFITMRPPRHTKNKCMVQIPTRGLFLTCTENSFLFCTHTENQESVYLLLVKEK